MDYRASRLYDRRNICFRFGLASSDFRYQVGLLYAFCRIDAGQFRFDRLLSDGDFSRQVGSREKIR